MNAVGQGRGASSWMLTICGVWLVALGLYFIAVRPPLLPEDARIVGGILSSATPPVSAAYVADMTTERQRSRGMAWMGTAASLGFVVGPALGGLLSRSDLHLTARFGHFLIDSFSVPFFAAALLGVLALLAAF